MRKITSLLLFGDNYQKKKNLTYDLSAETHLSFHVGLHKILTSTMTPTEIWAEYANCNGSNTPTIGERTGLKEPGSR